MMNNDKKQAPKGNSPIYRSVKMASSSMAPLPSVLRSPFQQDLGNGKQQQPHQPMLRHQQQQQQQQQQESSKTSSSDHSIPSLCSPLPCVPAEYMLERNQIHIQSTPPTEIANLVVESLHVRSYTISETSSEIKNGIRAESDKGLLFRVNFFKDNSTNGVLVEFQRLAGCSYEFQRAFQAVQRHVTLSSNTTSAAAASSSSSSSSSSLLPTEPERANVIAPVMQELKFPTCCIPPQDINQHNATEKLQETFHIALDLMQSERIDSQLLGLECMEPLSMKHEILPLLFEQESSLEALLKFCTPPNEALSQLEQQQDCLLKRRALSILANGLELATTPNVMDSTDQVLQTLLECLFASANKDAHQSFQVARCFIELSKEDEASQAILKESQVLQILTQQKHLALEQECQKLQQILSDES
ncbi:unnamed protein product [Cylindrotheca closterium]|uniref:Uncharacterized protein n=1 Tax=Cylindrotheca closterium TaxID=2856 RepID=A0AAD2G944_9STRA|nr:unnamed protein product [Cylindrotheca closterium]